MTNFLAAQTNIGNFSGIGPLGNTAAYTGTTSLTKFESVISTIIGVITVFAGLWFIIQLFVGAFKWLQAGGDKQALDNAKKSIEHAIVGLLIVVAAYTITGIIGLIFGFNILDVSGQLINLHP